MNFKKIVTLLVTALVLAVMPLTSSVAKAEEESYDVQIEALSTGYAVVQTFISEGGTFNEHNIQSVVEATSNATLAGEELKLKVLPEDYNRYYRNMHTDVFQVYKNALVYLMQNACDESIYSPSNNGVVLLNQKLSEYSLSVKTSLSHQDATSAYEAFIQFLQSGELTLKVSVLETGYKQPIKATVTSSSPIFGQDDVITTSFFLDTVIIKNTKVALIDNENLIDQTSGVAKFFSIRWNRDGVILEGNSVPETSVSFKINLEDLGLTPSECNELQLVRYLGNQEVQFVEGATLSSDGYIEFTLTSFGEDIDTVYDLDFAVVIKGYALETPSVVGAYLEENLVLVLIIVGSIVLLYLISKIVSRVKARKKRKEYKKFKKYLKQQKKEKKRAKKEKRKAKKLKKKQDKSQVKI